MNLERSAPDSGRQFAGALAIGVVLLVAVTAVVMAASGGVAVGWVAGLAVLLVAVGASSGLRALVSLGVVALAVASIVLTYDAGLGRTLVVNAAVASVCMTALLGVDLSFAARRQTMISNIALAGFARVHAIATGIGVLCSVSVLAIMLNVDWPGWLLLLPAVVLTCAMVGLLLVARNYQHVRDKASTKTTTQASRSRQ